MLLFFLAGIAGGISFLVYCCIIVGSRSDRHLDDPEQERYLAEYAKKTIH